MVWSNKRSLFAEFLRLYKMLCWRLPVSKILIWWSPKLAHFIEDYTECAKNPQTISRVYRPRPWTETKTTLDFHAILLPVCTKNTKSRSIKLTVFPKKKKNHFHSITCVVRVHVKVTELELLLWDTGCLAIQAKFNFIDHEVSPTPQETP